MSNQIQTLVPTRGDVGLHRFAILTAACTFPLIFIGGLVTSKGAALAVPDWPTTYGYNMFFFPWSKMVGGIFYEHSHRLVASFVGLLTTILAVWMWFQEKRRWLRWLGVIAFGAVLFQGILGGLRVLWLKQEIAIFHACLAQAFFCLITAIAVFTSNWWRNARQTVSPNAARLRGLCVTVTILIFCQLILGATMRHTASGMAIPDFPLAYGQVVPPFDAASVETLNQARIWKLHLDPVSAGQIAIHFAHRLGAIVVTLAVLTLTGFIFARGGQDRALKGFAIAMLLLVAAQIALGAATVLTNKAADIATTHVAVGALTLVTGFCLTLVVYRRFAPQPVRAPATDPVLAARSTVLAS